MSIHNITTFMQGGNSLQPLLSISVAIPNHHKLQSLNLNHYYGQSRHEENHYIWAKLWMIMELFMH